jgi:hypothetical protein
MGRLSGEVSWLRMFKLGRICHLLYNSKFPLASVDAAVFNNLGPYYVESPNIEVFCIDLDQPLYRDDYDIVSIRYVAGSVVVFLLHGYRLLGIG